MRPTSGWPKLFVVVSIIEAFTWAGLLVGMLLKHVTKTTELGVQVFGPLHGAAFISYLVTTFFTARRQGWNGKIILLALAASIPPLFTVLFERWAVRHGHLADRQPAASATTAA